MPQALPEKILSALIGAKSLAFFPIAQPKSKVGVTVTVTVAGRGVKVRQAGKVDIALLLSTKAADRKAALQASDNVFFLREGARIPRRRPDQLVFGADCGLWTPTIQLGMKASWQAVSSAPPCIILSESRALAAHLLKHAQYRRLNLVAAVAMGSLAKVRWQDLAIAATKLTTTPRILVAVQRPLDLAWVLDNAAALRYFDLFLPQRLDQFLPPSSGTPPQDATPIAATSLLRELGARLFNSPEQLIEGAWLEGKNKGKSTRMPLLVVGHKDSAEILEEAAQRNGLKTANPGPIARALNKTKKGVNFTAGALVVDKRTLPPQSGVSFTIGTVAHGEDVKVDLVYDPVGRGDDAIDDATLQALAIAPRRSGIWKRETLPASAEVTTLLDNLPAQLQEMQTRELCQLFGMGAVPAQAVRSPSAAGSAASRLGAPLCVHAAGAESSLRSISGTTVAGLTSAAQVREAYNSIVHHCSVANVDTEIDSLIVSRIPAHRVSFDITLRWLNNTCILQILGRANGGETQRADLLPAPPSKKRLTELFKRLSLSAREAAQLEAFLNNLTRLANTLNDRMHWLRLYCVVLPTEEPPAQIVEANALQRFHLRSIFGVLT